MAFAVTIFQFPAVGDRGPAVFPVIVSPSPVPLIVTKPLAPSSNLAESKEATPAFVGSEVGLAEAYWTSTVFLYCPNLLFLMEHYD